MLKSEKGGSDAHANVSPANKPPRRTRATERPPFIHVHRKSHRALLYAPFVDSRETSLIDSKVSLLPSSHDQPSIRILARIVHRLGEILHLLQTPTHQPPQIRHNSSRVLLEPSQSPQLVPYFSIAKEKRTRIFPLKYLYLADNQLNLSLTTLSTKQSKHNHPKIQTKSQK